MCVRLAPKALFSACAVLMHERCSHACSRKEEELWPDRTAEISRRHALPLPRSMLSKTTESPFLVRGGKRHSSVAALSKATGPVVIPHRPSLCIALAATPQQAKLFFLRIFSLLNFSPAVLFLASFLRGGDVIEFAGH